MSMLHDKDCECCKGVNLGTKKAAAEIISLVGSSTGGAAKKTILKELEKIDKQLAPAGGIKDIIQLTKRFFAVNFENLKPGNLGAPKPKAKVGKFKAIDITDNPTIDVTKAINFKGLNLSALNKLKISVTVPTITLEKTLKFGPVSLGIKFLISLKDVSWAPAISADFDTPEKALAALKNAKVSKPVTPSEGKSLKDLQKLAAGLASPSLKKDLQSAKTTDEFFKKLDTNQITLIEEKSVGDEMAKMYKDAQASAKLIKEASVSKFSCDERKAAPEPATFTPAEVEEIDPCKIDAALEAIALEAQANIQELKKELKELQELAKDVPTESTAEEAKKALDDFLGKTNENGKQMDKCSKDRQSAKTRLDFFTEVQILHQIPLEYLRKRKEAYGGYGNPFATLIKKRDDLNAKNAELNAKVIKGQATPADLNTIKANQDVLSSLENQYNSAVSAFTKATEELEDAATSTLFGSSDPIKNARKKLESENNPVSNQVGFDANGNFQLYVAKEILPETLKILEEARGPQPAPSLPSPLGIIPVVGGAPEIINTYFKPTVYDFDNATPLLPRTGVIEEGVWKKYYSPQRIDLLFTYKEQGYTAPKPVYDSKGKPVSAVKKVEFVNGLKKAVSQEVPTSVAECQVDLPVASDFLENIEKYTEKKIQELVQSIKAGSTYKIYEKKILSVAELESRLAFSNTIASSTFSTTNINFFENNTPVEFERSLQVAQKIDELIEAKIKSIKAEIKAADDCIAASKKKMVDDAKDYAAKVNGKVEGLEESNSIKKEAMAKLGSDPVGATPGNPQFPNYSKNCYWKEYTKILQTVSLMPIPDTEFLNKRLFRYYPVALQFPAGPAPLPTLALGIPDALISVPLPYLWVHVLTISTPFGTFVLWIALAGGIIPNPFLMFIDEKNEPMFLVTPRGPVDLPASQLGITADEYKSVLDYLKVNKTLKIDMGTPLGKLVTGSTNGDPTDPDDAKNVIENIKSKIKKSLDDMEFEDPDFAILTEEGRAKKDKIKKALEQFPPDPKVIDEALKSVMKIAEKKIDDLKISPIKIPKSPKKRAIEPPPIMEQLDTFIGLVDSAMSAPEEVMNIVLKDLGIGIKTLDVKKKLTEKAKSAIDKPKFKEKLKKADEKIDALEQKIADSDVFSADAAAARQEKIEKRAKAVKDFLVDYLKGVADEITPEMLGFVAIASSVPPLPEPCFTAISLPPVPPWVAIALALIKQAPNIIKAIDEKRLAELLANTLNLEKPLPSAERLFYSAFDTVLSQIPDVKIPTDVDVSLSKNIKESLKEWLKTYKLRLPKVGLPTQIVIPPQLIKSIIKTAFQAFVTILVGLIMKEINKALKLAGPEAVGAVMAAIAIIKLLLGVDLSQIKGADIKAFLKTTIETVAYPPLDQVKTLIDTANKLKSDFKSIKETFSLPNLKRIAAEFERGKGPFIEVGTKELKAIVDPLLETLVINLSKSLPYPVILLGCSVTPSRIAFTKINPTKAFEVLPSWEGITTKNIPFIVWLDQLAASAQRYSLLGSDYVTPYFTPPSA